MGASLILLVLIMVWAGRSGNAPPSSMHHRVYGIMEAVKPALLILPAIIQYLRAHASNPILTR